MNLPTALTVSRIALCPLFVLIYLYPHFFGLGTLGQTLALFFLVVFILVTDALDGYLARKLRKVTNLGKLLDPMSDCIAFLSIFFSFTQKPIELPLFLPLIMMVREIVVVYLRSLVALRREAMAARFSGKLKTAAQSTAVIATLMMMLFYHFGWIELETLQTLALTFMAIAAATSIASLVEYGISCKEVIYDSFRSPSNEI
ncbi:MAG: CDP-diacylglycerol--glycerol-3-phosphate 3-phosphatidyltransferase [Chlamydiia bacterium]